MVKRRRYQRWSFCPFDVIWPADNRLPLCTRGCIVLNDGACRGTFFLTQLSNVSVQRHGVDFVGR